MPSLKYLLPLLILAPSMATLAKKPAAPKIPVPESFTANCQACHMLDKVQVGPSLVEIAEIYPESKRADFIKWCLHPGKKRDLMPQMPAMTHIPEADLNTIYDYIRKVSKEKGGPRMPTPKGDPYPDTERPRIVRTFIPDTGPASMIVALPTNELHNLIWDTDKCRLRYISTGKIDNWPYLRSNGGSTAKVGKVAYTQEEPLFKSANTQFLGYHLSKKGMPALVYSIDGNKVTEIIDVKSNVITRTIKGHPSLPAYNTLKSKDKKLETTTSVSGNVIIITHRPR